MIVYRGPREAVGGGVRNWGGVGVFGPNITENSQVCTARVPSMPGCPGSPLPVTMIGWASPGPVMRAWDGPFASAGVASVSTVARLMPAASVVRTISLRSMGRLVPLCLTPDTPAAAGGFPCGAARCQCAERAMASAAVLLRLPSRRSATCPVPQISVLPVVSRAEAAAEEPSRVMYTSSWGPLIHAPLAPFTWTLVIVWRLANFWKYTWSR